MLPVFDLENTSSRPDSRHIRPTSSSWPTPSVVLAMAQHRRGDRDEAKRTLALAVFDFARRTTRCC
jgi:hypothetical protein